MTWTLPNIITIIRIILTPGIAILPFLPGYWPKLIAFVVFLIAGFSDTLDGYLARKHNQISELGQFLDPIADKLLLFATLVPIFWLTHHPSAIAEYPLPWWGPLPLWVVIVLIVRELTITGFRWFAKRKGVVIAAHGPGKLKATFQAIFIGAALAWFAWRDMAATLPIAPGFVRFWEVFHGIVVSGTLLIAVVLTVYSLAVYLYRYRTLLQ